MGFLDSGSIPLITCAHCGDLFERHHVCRVPAFCSQMCHSAIVYLCDDCRDQATRATRVELRELSGFHVMAPFV